MSNEPETPHCGNCRFWDVSGEGFHNGDIGDCRNEPPRISDGILATHMRKPQLNGAAYEQEELESDIYYASAFPITHRESWCGRFEWLPGLGPVTV